MDNNATRLKISYLHEIRQEISTAEVDEGVERIIVNNLIMHIDNTLEFYESGLFGMEENRNMAVS